jgi:hypothetical protein
VSDGCLVLVAPVSSDMTSSSGPPNSLFLHTVLIIGVYGEASGSQKKKKKKKMLSLTPPNLPGHVHMGNSPFFFFFLFFKVVFYLLKQAEFPKREFGHGGNQIRDDGDVCVTHVSFDARSPGVVPTTLRVKNPQMKKARMHCCGR